MLLDSIVESKNGLMQGYTRRQRIQPHTSKARR